MGAGASSDLQQLIGASSAGLGEMPELCAAEVLLRLDAPDICRLARLNRTFRSAADADFLWEAKLPENYGYLMGFVGGENTMEKKKKKKEVYARLSKAVPFDHGKREFWLEKSTGMVCMALSSRALLITGIDDRRYWLHMPTAESRFHSVAYLQQIWWLEVIGEIDFRFPPGTYSLYFRLRLGQPPASTTTARRGSQHQQHVHGWDKKPVRFQLSTSDGQHAMSQCYLEEDHAAGWALYHAGDFSVASSRRDEQQMKLKFSLAQIDCTHTKGGLYVDSVVVYPAGGFRREKVVVPAQLRSQ